MLDRGQRSPGRWDGVLRQLPGVWAGVQKRGERRRLWAPQGSGPLPSQLLTWDAMVAPALALLSGQGLILDEWALGPGLGGS